MNHRTEALVIGGSAIGICCAYYLNRLGKTVTVIEKGEICSGSSYGNAGLIVPSYCIPMAAPGVISQALRWMFNPASPFYVKPRVNRDLLAWLWKFRGACNEQHVRKSIPVLRDLSFESLKLFEALAGIESLDFGFEKKGSLELFKTEKGLETAAGNFRLLREHGLEHEILDREKLQQITGGIRTTAVGGVFCPRDAHLIPDRFVSQLARRIETDGVRLLTSTEVLGFEINGRKVTAVKTTRGNLAAEEVVLAGGCWSALLARELQLRLWIEPAKGYSITYKRPSVCPAIPVVMAEAKVVLTPMDSALRLAGTLELAGFDQTIRQGRVQAILDAVSSYLPDIDPASLELIEIWGGLRPCTPDGLPCIGRPTRYDNVIIAAGHGMLGISLAPATGKIVARLAAGEPPAFDLHALSPERFG